MQPSEAHLMRAQSKGVMVACGIMVRHCNLKNKGSGSGYVSCELFQRVYSFPVAVITEYHKLGALYNRTVFLDSSRGCKSEMEV